MSNKNIANLNKNIYQILTIIQNEIKVKKNHLMQLSNNYNQIRYRSTEDIQAELKPLLEKYNVCCYICDEIVAFGSDLFVKANVFFTDGDETISVSGFAQIDITTKLNASQKTGSASTYARRYAMQALLMLDDNELDPDNLNNEALKKNKKNNLVIQQPPIPVQQISQQPPIPIQQISQQPPIPIQQISQQPPIPIQQAPQQQSIPIQQAPQQQSSMLSIDDLPSPTVHAIIFNLIQQGQLVDLKIVESDIDAKRAYLKNIGFDITKLAL